METDLSQAFYGVYNSSKEILKNNQRHLYCNMLDLLTNTCKTAGVIGNKIIFDDLVHFWLADILPLVFDKDQALQSSAITALNQGLTYLDISIIHRSIHWPELKNIIVTSYAPRIHKLREDHNKNWQTIWRLLIQILDREILKGASTINAFLAIVELGFRSPDNIVRSEAFSCWKLLIKIFSTYDELFSPKRLKLICIPLKSSQSRSPHTAVVKTKVWWYLITCLGSRIGQYFESVVEPFLIFSFGNSSSSHNVLGVSQQYLSVRELAVPCLISMLSYESNAFVERILRDNKLEPFCQPSPLLDRLVINQHWQPIFNATIEALRIIIKNDITNVESEELKQLLLVMLRIKAQPFTNKLFINLINFLPEHPRPIIFILNSIAADGFLLEPYFENLEGFSSILINITTLFIVSNSVVPPAILQRCIDQSFNFSVFQNTIQDQKCILSTSLNIVLKTNDDKNYKEFEIKLLIWRRLSQSIIDHQNENISICTTKDYSDILGQWILWPLKICGDFAGRRKSFSLCKGFCDIWRQILYSRQRLGYCSNILNEIKKSLLILMSTRLEEVHFADIFDAYACSSAKLSFVEKNTTYIRDLFEVINEAMVLPLQPIALEACLNTTRNVVVELEPRILSEMFDIVKCVLEAVVRLEVKGHIKSKFFEQWKHSILEKLRSHPNKNFVSQIKNLFKGKDDFVIIPSVWSLNPDKLTERQKERFAERADIPALYNDISQSQDMPIKPWTPKKVVIAKGDETEIVLESLITQSDDSVKTNKDSHLQKNKNMSSSTILIEDGNNAKDLRSLKKLKVLLKPVDDFVDNISKQTCYDTSKEKSTSDSKNTFTDTKNARKASFTCNQDECEIQKTKTDLRPEKCILNFENETPTKEEGSLLFETNQLNTSKESRIFENPKKSNNKYSYDLKLNTENATCATSTVRQNLEIQINSNDDNNKQAELASDTNLKDASISDINSKESSPKKTFPIKCLPLSSPPDRKLINNSTSPTLRPKPSAHLTGRGAQLINMIRNKKLDTANCPQFISMAKQQNKTDNLSAFNVLELSGTEIPSTPVQLTDLLTFSKRLPSPSASPSASILKRKIRRDSAEDFSVESPAFKRKRVSFHDPPVSITKEYVKDSEENKLKPKRCLILDKSSTTSTPEIKHVLKRRSKIESITELEKFAPNYPDLASQCSTNNMMCETAHQDPTKSCHDLSENSSTVSQDKLDEALDFVFHNFSLEDVLNKYYATVDNLQVQSVNELAKFISNCMSTNLKIKQNVLEIFSENHSKDFLDHAVQENLSSVVCDRLNLNSVIDYVCAKSKINSGCRNNLLQQIPDVIKYNKVELEFTNFLKNLMQNCKLTDNNILNLIATLVQMRSTMDESTSLCVSESAIDSSSNL